jgi:TonB family protein
VRVLALLALGACGGAEVAAPPPATAPAKTADPEEYAAVQQFMARKRPQVLMCYANAIENREISEKAKGRVKVSLAVLPSGTAADVQVADSTLKAKSVEDCIAAMVARWYFPTPSQRIELTYTYEFSTE